MNGQDCGSKWFGERTFDIKGLLHEGENQIEVRVATLPGNYARTLDENLVIKRFILNSKKIQPVAPMGMLGPVMVY